ncbi:hypothetical protein C8J32_11428 [Rhizobium sp. PP-CC-3A-592]|nr:hypothetical protein C8J32_11428 [Rhizobium sp. PP-CC-3A-592]
MSSDDVTVGIRFHDISKIDLLERCLNSVAGQTHAGVHVILSCQGFDAANVATVECLLAATLKLSGFAYEIINVANPDKLDLRSKLLNTIVDHHYGSSRRFLAFIDYDDIWFSHAISTLIDSFNYGPFALSYADIHCANLLYYNNSFYVKELRDVYSISRKSKRDLLSENFLPLHSYMFNTSILDSSILHYDTSLEVLEDYDVLLRVILTNPVSGLHRKELIGLYNFYSVVSGKVNTTPSIFEPPVVVVGGPWSKARTQIIQKHSGYPIKEYFGEQWELDALSNQG